MGSPVATLAGSATGYADAAVSAGSRYEYLLTRAAAVFAYGYLASGIEAPLVESRGKIVLVVDDTYAADLIAELDRLVLDLVGDGWTVLRHDVARNAPADMYYGEMSGGWTDTQDFPSSQPGRQSNHPGEASSIRARRRRTSSSWWGAWISRTCRPSPARPSAISCASI